MPKVATATMPTAKNGNAKTPNKILEDRWINAIKMGHLPPSKVIEKCPLKEESLDTILDTAYRENGGYPCGA